MVRSSKRSDSRCDWRAPVLRERNPSKVKRSVARPERASAIVGALGPGITTIGIFNAIASRVSLKPGSLIVGIPASETTSTRFPACKNPRTSSVRTLSFPSKNEMILAVKVTPKSEAKRWNLRESSAAIISALSMAAFKRGLASPGFPRGVAARVKVTSLILSGITALYLQLRLPLHS